MADPNASTPILPLVKKFNTLVRDIIEGPDCTDPTVCHGDCCFVNMDVPFVLADHYVRHGWAEKTEFIRGSHFSFRVKMDLETSRCPFFDQQINGCAVHFTGMKIPQCWVYPTGLDPTEDVPDCCKQACGWKITSQLNLQGLLSEIFTLQKQTMVQEELYILQSLRIIFLITTLRNSFQLMLVKQ